MDRWPRPMSDQRSIRSGSSPAAANLPQSCKHPCRAYRSGPSRSSEYATNRSAKPPNGRPKNHRRANDARSVPSGPNDRPATYIRPLRSNDAKPPPVRHSESYSPWHGHRPWRITAHSKEQSPPSMTVRSTTEKKHFLRRLEHRPPDRDTMPARQQQPPIRRSTARSNCTRVGPNVLPSVFPWKQIW